MATDFNANSTVITGGLRPSTVNTPLDSRTRIETLEDIYDIPVPYIGMIVYVMDTGKRYEIMSLKDKKVGPLVIKDVLVNEIKELTFYDESAEIFETDMLTVNAFGGIPANADLNGMTTHEILMKMLYPYVAPDIAISCTPNGGIFEKGSMQKISEINISIVKKSEPIQKIEIFDGNTIIATQEDESIKNGGTFNFPVDVEVNSNKSLTIKITDAQKINAVSTNKFEFVYPYYVGVCEEDAQIDDQLILGLSKRNELKGNKQINFTTSNQKMIIAYPVEYGKISKIHDANSFDITSTFECNVINITGLDNTAQQYYVYNNNASTVNNFAIKFSY